MKLRRDGKHYRIISKYDECYRWTWVPTIRCDLCGDQHDAEFKWEDYKVEFKGEDYKVEFKGEDCKGEFER